MKLKTWLGLVLLVAGVASLVIELTTQPGQWHGWQVAWNLLSLALLACGLLLTREEIWNRRSRQRGR